MCREILLALVFCLCFTTILSIKCYIGYDNECALAPDITNCGDGEVCACAKYRFKCEKGDSACDENEQLTGVIKWGYVTLGQSTCRQMQSYPIVYKDVTCCLTDRCNQPSNAKCTDMSGRRRSLRKFANLFNY